MNDSGGNIERLLERYVLDAISDDDRRLVEQYLTGPGEDAAGAREDLIFEKALLKSISQEVPVHDVAGAVLERVFKRSNTESRKNYRPDLAANLLRRAQDDGRIHLEKPRQWRRNLGRVTAMAASFLVFAFLLWSSSTNAPRKPVDVPRAFADVDLGLIGEVAVVPCSANVKFDGVPAAPKDNSGRPLRVGDEITTDAEEMALLRVDEGQGRIALLPMSRVRFIRNTPGAPIALLVLEGGLHYDFRGQSAGVPIETDKGHRGKVLGQGEVLIASRSVGAQQPALESSLGQIVLVRVIGGSSAVFDSPQGKVRIGRGELGIVGPESAVTVTESALTKITHDPKSAWRVDEYLRDPDAEAMALPGKTLTRADIASEALRVYKYDLIELLAVSFVVDVELAHLGIAPTQGDHYDAMNFVRNDELLQVLPLRSEDATQMRAQQIAGLLAIDREVQRRKNVEFSNEPVAIVRQRIWPQLAARLKRNNPEAGEDLAFEFSYRDKTLKIGRPVAWARLRQFMRVSEVEDLMHQLSEKVLLATWLEKRGEHWHDEANAFTAQFVAMAQMTGMSRVQLEDSVRVAELIQSVVVPPSAAELESFMQKNVTKRRQLFFDHYFFPTTDPFRGYGLDEQRQLEAKAGADALVAELRAGKAAKLEPVVPRFQGSIWRNGRGGGPRPWWNEVYGRNFGLAVANLSAGDVSEPIRSAEGWHVVHMQHEGPQQTDPRAHESYARQLYRYELARGIFENMVKDATKNLIDPASLLR